MSIIDIPGIKQILDIGSTLVDRLVPDRTKAAEWRAEAEKAVLAMDLAEFQAQVELAKGQAEINSVEAASPSLFIAGWRPAVGWICAAGLSYAVILYPLACWANGLMNSMLSMHVPNPPQIDISVLMTLLFGMLGIGAYRTYEKVKGADTKTTR